MGTCVSFCYQTNLKATLHSRSGILPQGTQLHTSPNTTIKQLLKKLKSNGAFNLPTKSIAVLNKANVVLHHELKLSDVASEAIPVIHLWLETQDEGMRRMQEGEAARKDASKYYADGDMKMGKDYSPSTTVFTESFPGAAGDRKYLYLSVNSVTGIVNRRQVFQMANDADILTLLQTLQKQNKITIPIPQISVKLRQNSTQQLPHHKKLAELKVDTQVIELWLEHSQPSVQISLKVNSKTGVLNRELEIDIQSQKSIGDVVSFLNESGYIKVPLEKIIALDRNGKGLDMIKPLFELVNGRMDLWLEIRERY